MKVQFQFEPRGQRVEIRAGLDADSMVGDIEHSGGLNSSLPGF